MELQYIDLNGRRIIALPFFLEAILKIDADLKCQGIGLDTKKGLICGAVETSSWRSEALQKQLYNKGASKTMFSNHRRGVALDIFPDRKYIERIDATMEKYGLKNDLGDWDFGHYNWISNAHCWSYDIINTQPLFLREFSICLILKLWLSNQQNCL